MNGLLQPGAGTPGTVGTAHIGAVCPCPHYTMRKRGHGDHGGDCYCSGRPRVPVHSSTPGTAQGRMDINCPRRPRCPRAA